jgi:NAD(P) transhydrogenase subunit alpha
MRLLIPREITPLETRVALVPETVAKLAKSGFEVIVESGAGTAASFPDEQYQQAGATVAAGLRDAYARAELVVKVREPIANPALGAHEADLVPDGATLIAFLGRDRQSDAVTRLAARRVTAFSMEMIPRTSRAQKMDALSSMASIAGYKSALIAANALPKYFPLLMTAAGTIPPARAFILGAGVAGLQAIATCRRLGAQVEAFDVRPAVKEEVQSLGATFIGLELLTGEGVGEGGYAKELSADHQQKERDLIAARLEKTDVCITTANIPGKRAPLLLTTAMVERMRPGSVIIDLAAESGGNCELTRAGEVVDHRGVRIHGILNLPAQMPYHASQLYSRNVQALLQLMTKDGTLALDWEDDIIRDTCIHRPAAGAAVEAGRAS